MTEASADSPDVAAIESSYAWLRLVAAILIGTIGGVGMWSVAVALPAVQAEFDVTRGTASLPYTLTMLGFAAGGIFYGRMADRRGIASPLTLGALFLCGGYLAGSLAQSMMQFILVQGVLIGGLGRADRNR